MQKISFFCTGKNGSRTIFPEENLPPILALTIKLTHRGGGKFCLRGIAWTPVKIKETKNRKEIKNNRRKKK